MANGDDVASMTAAVRAAREVADLVFVTVHWGVELDTQPRADDVARAHALIDAGADGIFGHHSHRLQPLDSYRGRPIAWGLGNFVWPNLSDAGSRTAVAEFVVEPDGSVHGCLLPARITSPGHPVLTGPRSCPA
jgi:poly-gamma-glutamate synthesis protein (capsule biosynthesis protein)